LSNVPVGTNVRFHVAVVCLTAFTLMLAITAVSAQLSSTASEDAIAAPLVQRSLFLDGDAIGDHMVVVGERGHILVSRDAGASWTQAQVPTRATLTGVDFHDPAHGWAVGHDAIILRTRDGGLTWKTVHLAPEQERPLLDVWFENAEHGFAIGAYGYFLETHDGGDTWQTRSISEEDLHLNQIAGTPSGPLYIAAESGRIYRSGDHGLTWKPLTPPYKGSFFGTLPVDHRSVYLYGLRGHLFRSDDSGAHWSPVDTQTEHMLTSGLMFNGTEILFTGMGGTVLIGDDDGGSVRPFQRPDRRSIAGALDAGDGLLVIFGEFGVERTDTHLLERVQ
jgi:photosystem II stability/assembly factor-like uncharacterized protein